MRMGGRTRRVYTKNLAEAIAWFCYSGNEIELAITETLKTHKIPLLFEQPYVFLSADKGSVLPIAQRARKDGEEDGGGRSARDACDCR